MSTSDNTSLAKQQDGEPVAHNPLIDAAELARTKRLSPGRFEKLLHRYRLRGISDREIVAAMAASPRLIDPLGRGR